MNGLKSRTTIQTKALIELADNKCEQCGKTKELEVHRITPGYKGGTYIPRNCQILCRECHKMRAEEW